VHLHKPVAAGGLTERLTLNRRSCLPTVVD